MSDQCATCGAADVILFTCGYCGREFCADHDLPHHSCEGFAHPGEGVDEVTFEWGTEGRADPEDAFTASGFRPAAGGGEAATRSSAPRSAPKTATPAVEPLPRDAAAETTAAVQPAPRPTDDAVPAVERVPRRVARETTPAIERCPRSIEGDTRPAVTPTPRQVGPAVPAVERVPRTVTGSTEPAVRPTPRRPPRPTRRAVRLVPEPDPAPEPPAPATTGTTGSPGAGGEVATAATPGDSPAAGHIRTMDAKRSPGRVERREPRTLTEWLDQQTYVSLSVKTAALATVINGALYLGMMVTLYGLLPV